ncbi:hypothetical protein HDU82_002276, partial [Entophlyctis luteolus]
MERTTKKKAPTVTDFHIQFANFDEFESSTTARTGKGAVFGELIPGPKEQGKVFIGFPTHQTTGCSIHLAAHLIPTVERESIDFVDRSLNIWNQDLLTVGGLLCRILFEDEMSTISNLFSNGDLDDATRVWLYKRASHALQAFSFKASTPSNIVGRLNQMFFIKGCTQPLSMISTKGVLPLSSVRLPDLQMKGFIKEIPVVPGEAMTLCADLISELQSSRQIQPLGLSDVLVELNKRTLSTEEVVELLKWWKGYRRSNAVSAVDVSTLFQNLIVVDPTTPDKPPMRMADLKHHVNIKVIPPGLPLPNMVLSVEVSKHFSKQELEEMTGFMTELSVPQWLAFAVSLPEFATIAFVEKVLLTVSKQYSNLNRDMQAQVVATLSALPCIPTKHGLKRPHESYFKTVTLFDDLPVAALDGAAGRAVSDTFLKALGVRDYVDLAVVFARLQDLKWDSDHVQLVKYLASVQDKLTATEIARLKLTAAFTKEDEGVSADETNVNSSKESGVSESAAADSKKKPRFKASDLYAPNDAIRALGLPILDWPGKAKWRLSSDEAKFMIRLGLKTTIPWEELVERAAKCESDELRFKFLEYFVENWRSSLQPYADNFGVREHPSGMSMLDFLRKTPPTLENAVAVFSYLSGRQSEFSSSDWHMLRSLPFIPVKAPLDSQQKAGVVWTEPTKVYFGSPNSSAYHDLFTHIDFGEQSNAFLRACGVKDEPTPQELAEQLVRNPQSFMNLLGFAKYLQVLRTIAANYYQLRNVRSLAAEMRNSAFLVGVKTIRDTEVDAATDEDNERLQYQLAKANEIYIIDDTVLGQLFSPLGCPVETLLEDMYTDLGSLWLTKQVSEVTTARGTTSRSARTRKLQELINERALLLLYDGQQVRASKDIVPGSEETLKNLEVLEVPEITIERSFNGVVKKQSTTCCLTSEKRTKKYYLLIKENEAEVDYFDVAQALGKVIFRKSRLNDALLLSSLLSTSLINLKRKGFPVDRILNLQEGKLKAAIAKKQEEEARIRQEQQKAAAASSAAAAAAAASVAADSTAPRSTDRLHNNATPNSSNATESINSTKDSVIASTLLSMFPDVEKSYLQQQIEAEKSNPKAIEAISNKLLDSDYPKEKLNESVLPEKKIDEADSQRASTEEISRSVNKIADAVKSGFIGNLWERAKGAALGGSAPRNDTETQKLLSQESNNSGLVKTNEGHTFAGPGSSQSIEEVTPRYTENLKKQLSSSINTVKPSLEKEFRATVPQEPEQQPMVPARHSGAVCKPLLDSDLMLYERIYNTIPFFIDKNAIEEAQSVSAANRAALMRFVEVLRLLAKVFSLPERTMNIYWDKAGATVAFNRGKTLFFNFRFYLGLHFKPELRDGISGEDPDTVYYWFLTACHELAHNFIAEHDANHEFYFSSYAENYLGKLNKMLKS